MRGRKPIYSQEERLDIAQRLASGESPSAIAHATGKPRTSVIQCAKSARLPAALREQVLLQLKAKNAHKLLKLWGGGVEKVLRRIAQLAPKANEKGIHLMGQTLAAIKSVLPSAAGGGQGRITRVTDETRMIFERKMGVQEVVAAEAEENAPRDQGGSNPDGSEARADGGDAEAPAPTEAA